MVVELALDHIAAVALLDLGDEVRFLVVELTTELLFDDVENRGIIEFVRRLRQILTAVHALHHRRVLARAGDVLVLRGARAEPAISLKPQAGAEDSGLVLDATLDEEMVPENLGDGAVLLEHFAAFSGLLGETVEEVKRRSIWIHLVRNGRYFPPDRPHRASCHATQRRDATLNHENKSTQSKP